MTKVQSGKSLNLPQGLQACWGWGLTVPALCIQLTTPTQLMQGSSSVAILGGLQVCRGHRTPAPPAGSGGIGRGQRARMQLCYLVVFAIELFKVFERTK